MAGCNGRSSLLRFLIALDEVEINRNEKKKRTGSISNDYYTLYSLSVFSVAKSLQLTYRLLRLTNLTISIQVPCDGVFRSSSILTSCNV